MNTKLNILLTLFAGSLIFSPALAVSAEEATEAAEEAVVEEAMAEETATEQAAMEEEAATEEAAVAETAEEAAAATTATGSIVSVNTAEQYVVIDSGVAGEDGATETSIFYFSESLKVTKGGETAAAADLTEGDKVSIEYSTDEDGNKVISTITAG